MFLLMHTLTIFVILGILFQMQIVFGALTRSSEFTCYSCIGDQNSVCATDPANANYSHFGGDNTGDIGSFNSSTVSCAEGLYCLSLVIGGDIKGVATKVYYRSCLIDCDFIKIGFDTGIAASLIPDGVLDNVVLDICESCDETNCNSKNYSDETKPNSAVEPQTLFLLMIAHCLLLIFAFN